MPFSKRHDVWNGWLTEPCEHLGGMFAPALRHASNARNVSPRGQVRSSEKRDMNMSEKRDEYDADRI